MPTSYKKIPTQNQNKQPGSKYWPKTKYTPHIKIPTQDRNNHPRSKYPTHIKIPSYPPQIKIPIEYKKIPIQNQNTLDQNTHSKSKYTLQIETPTPQQTPARERNAHVRSKYPPQFEMMTEHCRQLHPCDLGGSELSAGERFVMGRPPSGLWLWNWKRFQSTADWPHSEAPPKKEHKK